MKTLKSFALLLMIAMFAVACNKTATQNQNTQAAKPANTSVAPAPTPVTAPKAEVKPVSTAADGGNIYSHPEGGLQFEAPPNWKADASAETITITSPDSSISIVFWVPKEADMDDALKALDQEFAKVMKNIKTKGEPEKGTLHGMEVYNVEGTGEINGATINWGGHLIQAKKPVIVLAFWAPGADEKYNKDLETFVQSIKKTS